VLPDGLLQLLDLLLVLGGFSAGAVTLGFKDLEALGLGTGWTDVRKVSFSFGNFLPNPAAP
jgi:hypothetical protein